MCVRFDTHDGVRFLALPDKGAGRAPLDAWLVLLKGTASPVTNQAAARTLVSRVEREESKGAAAAGDATGGHAADGEGGHAAVDVAPPVDDQSSVADTGSTFSSDLHLRRDGDGDDSLSDDGSEHDSADGASVGGGGGGAGSVAASSRRTASELQVEVDGVQQVLAEAIDTQLRNIDTAESTLRGAQHLDRAAQVFQKGGKVARQDADRRAFCGGPVCRDILMWHEVGSVLAASSDDKFTSRRRCAFLFLTVLSTLGLSTYVSLIFAEAQSTLAACDKWAVDDHTVVDANGVSCSASALNGTAACVGSCCCSAFAKCTDCSASSVGCTSASTSAACVDLRCTAYVDMCNTMGAPGASIAAHGGGDAKLLSVVIVSGFVWILKIAIRVVHHFVVPDGSRPPPCRAHGGRLKAVRWWLRWVVGWGTVGMFAVVGLGAFLVGESEEVSAVGALTAWTVFSTAALTFAVDQVFSLPVAALLYFVVSTRCGKTSPDEARRRQFSRERERLLGDLSDEETAKDRCCCGYC